jgi:hypothetical protein
MIWAIPSQWLNHLLTSCSRTATVTAKVLNEFKEQTSQTMSRLEKYFQELISRPHQLPPHREETSVEGVAKLELIQKEKSGILQCLSFCSQISSEIDRFQSNIFEDISEPADHQRDVISTIGELLSPRRFTSNALIHVQGKLSSTTRLVVLHCGGKGF